MLGYADLGALVLKWLDTLDDFLPGLHQDISFRKSQVDTLKREVVPFHGCKSCTGSQMMTDAT